MLQRLTERPFYGVPTLSGLPIQDAKNKLQPSILLHIVSFGMLIFGIVLIIDAFSMGYYSVLGLIGWLGWHLVSIIFGVGILRAK